MENMKLKGAVSVTLLALGGLAGAAISSNAENPTNEPSASLKPRVRTEVIKRTIHRTRMAKPEVTGAAPSAPATVAAAPATSSYTSAPSYTPAPTTTSTEPPVTSSSGSTGGGGSYESDDSYESEHGYEAEGGHESEGEDD